MPELDVLTVRLDADIAAFQAQLDRARAELSRFATQGGARAAAATDNVTKATTRAIPGLARLGNAFENMATRAAGVPGVLGKVVDVFGSLAVGSGPMVLAFAGLAGAAALFRKITEDARETKKAAEDALKAVTNTWLSRQTQGDIDLIQQQGDVGAQLDAAVAKLQKARDDQARFIQGAAARIRKHEQEVLELRTGYDRVTALLDERRGERQQEAAERAARAEEQAANDAAAAWKRAYAEMEESARFRVGTTPEGIQRPVGAETMGFAVIFPAVKDADNALAQLKNTVEKLNRELGLVPVGSTTPEGPGFVGRVGGRLKDLLNPEMILSGVVSGFLTQGINLVVGGIGKVVGGLLGLGSASDEAAQRLQAAVSNIRGEIARLRGDTERAEFFELQAGVRQRLETLGLPTGTISQTTNIAELQEFLRHLQALMEFSGRGADVALIMEWLQESMKGLGDEVNRLSDSLRNIPQGYKIAFAQFNATTPSPALAGAVGANLTVTVRAEPEGIFRAVERRAVQVKRTGGVLAWELDV